MRNHYVGKLRRSYRVNPPIDYAAIDPNASIEPKVSMLAATRSKSTPTAADDPFVSIITNSFNSVRHLTECIKSAVTQDYQNWEHIIVDCGSTDGSVDLVNSLAHDRLRLIRTEFCGVADGRRIGISHARGTLLAVLDSDDVWRADRLSRQVEILRKRPEAVAVGCGIIKVDQARSTSKAYGYPESDIENLLEVGINPLPHSTVLMRREAYARAGGYSSDLEKCEDYELLLRLRRFGPLLSISDPLVQYVSHPGSHTETHKPQGRDQTYYAIFALILNASSTNPPEPDAIHRWLAEVGPEGVAALHARWALRGLIRNAGKLSARSYMYLLSLIGRKSLAIPRVWRKPWWRSAASPRETAAAIASRGNQA
jgi:GT2 family glycosyltransferase